MTAAADDGGAGGAAGALRGRVAVITGVTSGIGEALARRMLGAGATVAGVGRDAGRLGEAAARFGAGERFVPVVADLADPAARTRGAAELRARFPRVDVLVNNAALVVYETPLGLQMARWRELLEVNVLAGVELVQALATALRGGHVINLSSAVARHLPNPKFAPYALTKAAVEQATDALRQELAPAGVKVTLLVPGLVATTLYDRVEGFARARARLEAEVPEWLEADDVADAAMWVLAQPPRVAVAEVVLMPRAQSR